MNNNIENMSGQGSAVENTSVEAFRSMSPNARHELVVESLKAQGKAEQFSSADVEAIVYSIGRLSARGPAQTLSEMFELATDLYSETTRSFASTHNVLVTDREGNVITGGSDAVSAMKKAQIEKAE